MEEVIVDCATIALALEHLMRTRTIHGFRLVTFGGGDWFLADSTQTDRTFMRMPTGYWLGPLDQRGVSLCSATLVGVVGAFRVALGLVLGRAFAWERGLGRTPVRLPTGEVVP